MKQNKNNVLIIALLFALIFFSGCVAKSIKDVKNLDSVGKRVIVSGTVENTLKIGEISGYTIQDETDAIYVSSEVLPAEGNKVRVTGILMKDTILGYYIKAE